MRSVMAFFIAITCVVPVRAAGFVKVKGTHFTRDGKPYYFAGANFWYGMNLASKGAGGDRARLDRELDRLKALGVTNLRVLAASEGPDGEPWRAAPALQPKPENYNQYVLDGLDYLLDAAAKRQMTAVVVLNNFWPWSGGMAQYVAWHSSDTIPYPPPAEGGDWTKYQKYTARFYHNAEAMKHFERVVKFLVTRKNKYSGLPYAKDPAIMAWELANEPRGIDDPAAYRAWIAKTSKLIKSLDQNHLVTTGSEGETPDPKSAGLDLKADHASPSIDYATMHLWAANWGWFDPAQAETTFPRAGDKAKRYIEIQAAKAKELGKPLVLEEFGFPRDGGGYDPKAPTTLKDRYYGAVFQMAADARAAGVNFWAWSGEGRPRKAGGYWKAGDDLLGDPPHEAQGWYGVYDDDAGTQTAIKNFAAKLDLLNRDSQ